MGNVQKRSLVMDIATRRGLKQSDVKTVIDDFFATVVAGLANGESFELRNFGVFSSVKRPARVGRNPKTGQTVAIPERRACKFKAGRLLKAALKKA
jgi:nucleoid DNA-binding protein